MCTRIVSLIALTVLLTGCRKDLDISTITAQPITIATYSGGKVVGERTVAPPSSLHEQLAAWVERNNAGWKRSYVSYAPGTLVKGTNFTLNILPSGLILNIEGGQFESDASVPEITSIFE